MTRTTAFALWLTIAVAQEHAMTAPPAELPAQHVLEGVPYCGEDWSNRLTGPEDFAFPACLRSANVFLGGDPERDYRVLLAVCGLGSRHLWHPAEWRIPFDNLFLIAADPLEPIRRACGAVGLSFEIVGNAALCAERGLPLGVFDTYGDAELIRQRTCASLAAGRPVIAFGPGDAFAGLLAGYEDEGKTVVGWPYVFDGEDKAERDARGYVRVRDWLDKTAAVLLITGRTEAPPLKEVLREAVRWAVEAARTPRIGDFACGADAFRAWAAAMERDEDVQPGDLAELMDRHIQHFMMGLAVAEGRAFFNDVCRRAAELWPEAAEELNAAASLYGLQHDLMWRLWAQTGGIGHDEGKAMALSSARVRREIEAIIRVVGASDAEATDNLERASLQMGVPADQLAPRQAEPPAAPFGADLSVVRFLPEPSTRTRSAEPGLLVDGVPPLGFGKGQDCTFIGALAAALAATPHPVSYQDLMGASGLAFRTRWFDNPEQAPTRWGTLLWHPVSAEGGGDEELAAISAATGWRFRKVELPGQGRDEVQDRLTTEVVLSMNAGLPLVVGLNTDSAAVYGYHIHSMNLFVRDYQHPDEEVTRFTHNDPGLHGPYLFLMGHDAPPPVSERLRASLEMAVRNGRRGPDGPFRYGLDALAAWSDALAGWDGYTAEERDLLFRCNAWCLMHLADARRAAVAFLEGHHEGIAQPAVAAYDRALELYRQELAELARFTAEHQDFVPWWGGTKGAADLTAEARDAQVELLGRAYGLEEQALAALAEALAQR